MGRKVYSILLNRPLKFTFSWNEVRANLCLIGKCFLGSASKIGQKASNFAGRNHTFCFILLIQ